MQLSDSRRAPAINVEQIPDEQLFVSREVGERQDKDYACCPRTTCFPAVVLPVTEYCFVLVKALGRDAPRATSL
jgi:hypothetical protein